MINDVLEKINQTSDCQFCDVNELLNISVLIYHEEKFFENDFCRVTNIYSIYLNDKRGNSKVMSYCTKETSASDIYGSIVGFSFYEAYILDSCN